MHSTILYIGLCIYKNIYIYHYIRIHARVRIYLHRYKSNWLARVDQSQADRPPVGNADQCYIVEHWDKEVGGDVRTMHVYTNRDSVRLLVNGAAAPVCVCILRTMYVCSTKNIFDTVLLHMVPHIHT
jgi:hypothetical protein